MAADTKTRADDVQAWVEFDGLSTFLSCLLHEIDEAHGRRFIKAISWDGMTVNDELQSESELFEALWPSDDDFEDRAEWHVANARSSMIAAGVLQWLASSDGRRYCTHESSRMLGVAQDALVRAERARGADREELGDAS
jgi:hypothetical protein